jgi:hypothetical protein
MVRRTESGVLKLEAVSRLPGKRVLAWQGRTLYASERYRLLRCDPLEDPGQWHTVARFDPGRLRGLGSRSRLTQRLLRSGFHALEFLSSGRMVAVVAGAIVVADPGEAEFWATFSIRRGTRPLTLAVTPDDKIYCGEYFGNPDRDELHIYGSSDQGESWDVVHTFSRGEIRHVHSVTWDPYQQLLWVLTGDYGDECRILTASPDFRDVDTVIRGDQQARAATCLPTERALYFATDTHIAQNRIYRLDRSGHLETLETLEGSSLQSCRVGDNLIFSTAVEPSKVNTSRFVTLVGSTDGASWDVLTRWRKDRLPGGLFQFGNAVLPTGHNDTDLLAATGVAVSGQDQATSIWRIQSRDLNP